MIGLLLEAPTSKDQDELNNRSPFRKRGRKSSVAVFGLVIVASTVLGLDGISEVRRKYPIFMQAAAASPNKELMVKSHTHEAENKNKVHVEKERIFLRGIVNYNDNTQIYGEDILLNETAQSYTEIEDKELHCSIWKNSLDEWWQTHPDWEPSLENATHVCFSPIEDSERADFYRQLQQSQSSTNCSTLRTRFVVASGFAASISYLLAGFWSAFREGRPFERSKHWEGFRWFYAPPYDPSRNPTNQSSWAACPSQDMTCYFLPLTTECQNDTLTIGHEDRPIAQYYKTELKNDLDKQEQFLWLTQYFMRLKQKSRYQLYQLQKAKIPLGIIPKSCTVMHVRRADATSEPRHPRNYYPVSRYISRGNLTAGSRIVLLTDDQSTIEEANALHPDFEWIYVNRTRHRGKVPTHSHIPSNDEALEFLYIMAELKMASKCNKLVHATSNMVKLIKQSMQAEHGMDNVELIAIDDDVDFRREDPTPADEFIRELEEKLRNNR